MLAHAERRDFPPVPCIVHTKGREKKKKKEPPQKKADTSLHVALFG